MVASSNSGRITGYPDITRFWCILVRNIASDFFYCFPRPGLINIGSRRSPHFKKQSESAEVPTMTIHRMLWSAAILAALSVTLVAQQQAPSGYHRVTCVKVKPGRTAEFQALVTGDISKVEHSEVDSGTISGWLLLRTIVPSGSDATCDYVLVAFYPGLPSAPMSDDETKAVIDKAGIGKTLSEWRQEHAENGYQVNNNITRYVSLVGAAKKGDYLVFNSMSVSDISAWVDWEKKNWQPFAEALLKMA
jgi:hypothetical protein